MRDKRQITLGLLLFVCCLALGSPAHAQTVDKRQAEITTTQNLEFGAKGTIQIVDSFGTVKVEGWDGDSYSGAFRFRQGIVVDNIKQAP